MINRWHGVTKPSLIYCITICNIDAVSLRFLQSFLRTVYCIWSFSIQICMLLVWNQRFFQAAKWQKIQINQICSPFAGLYHIWFAIYVTILRTCCVWLIAFSAAWKCQLNHNFKNKQVWTVCNENTVNCTKQKKNNVVYAWNAVNIFHYIDYSQSWAQRR